MTYTYSPSNNIDNTCHTMRKSITNLLARKLMTLPRLSPSHTSARLIRRHVPSGSNVVEYQPIMTVQCSSDLIGEYPSPITSMMFMHSCLFSLGFCRLSVIFHLTLLYIKKQPTRPIELHQITDQLCSLNAWKRG